MDAIAGAFPGRSRSLHERRLQEQRRDDALYLIAWFGGAAAGHLLLRWPGWPERSQASELQARFWCAFIEDLFVSTGSRKRGVGRALMHAAEAEARARQIGSIGLAVGLDDGYVPARQLYASLGYRDPGLGAFIESAAIPSDDAPPSVWLDKLVFLVKGLSK